MGYSDTTLTLKLYKDKIYNLVFLRVKEEKTKLLEDYLQKAMEISGAYGGRMIANFDVIEARTKHMNPNAIRIFEWSDLNSRNRAFNSDEFKEIHPLREVALSELKIGFFSVKKTQEIHLCSKKIYEIAGFTLFSETNPKLVIERYYQIPEANQEIIGNTKPKIITSFEPSNSHQQATYEHQTQCIVERDIAWEKISLLANEEKKRKSYPVIMSPIKSSDTVFATIVSA